MEARKTRREPEPLGSIEHESVCSKGVAKASARNTVADTAAKPGSWKPSDPLAACCGVYDGETRFAERDPRLVGLRAARRKGWVVLTGSGPISAELTTRGVVRVEEHRARAR